MLNVSIIYAYLISNIYGYKNNNTCIHTFIDVMIDQLRYCQVLNSLHLIRMFVIIYHVLFLNMPMSLRNIITTCTLFIHLLRDVRGNCIQEKL